MLGMATSVALINSPVPIRYCLRGGPPLGFDLAASLVSINCCRPVHFGSQDCSSRYRSRGGLLYLEVGRKTVWRAE